MSEPIAYELIPHTADLAIRVRGRDMPELFVNAARALGELLALPPERRESSREIALDGYDAETLLVNWLNELIWLHETDRLAFTTFRILEFSPTRLLARAEGGPSAETLRVIKAATFNDLRITPTADGVEATIVFDV